MVKQLLLILLLAVSGWSAINNQPVIKIPLYDSIMYGVGGSLDDTSTAAITSADEITPSDSVVTLSTTGTALFVGQVLVGKDVNDKYFTFKISAIDGSSYTLQKSSFAGTATIPIGDNWYRMFRDIDHLTNQGYNAMLDYMAATLTDSGVTLSGSVVIIGDSWAKYLYNRSSHLSQYVATYINCTQSGTMLGQLHPVLLSPGPTGGVPLPASYDYVIINSSTNELINGSAVSEFKTQSDYMILKARSRMSSSGRVIIFDCAVPNATRSAAIKDTAVLYKNISDREKNHISIDDDYFRELTNGFNINATNRNAAYTGTINKMYDNVSNGLITLTNFTSNGGVRFDEVDSLWGCKFDGSGYLKQPISASQHTQTYFTYELWVKFESISATKTPLIEYKGEAYYGAHLNGDANLIVNIGSTNICATSRTLSVDSLYNIIVTKKYGASSDSVIVYVNGQKATQISGAGYSGTRWYDTLRIGADYNSIASNMWVYQYMFWGHREISESEALERYNKGVDLNSTYQFTITDGIVDVDSLPQQPTITSISPSSPRLFKTFEATGTNLSNCKLYLNSVSLGAPASATSTSISDTALGTTRGFHWLIAEDTLTGMRCSTSSRIYIKNTQLDTVLLGRP